MKYIKTFSQTFTNHTTWSYLNINASIGGEQNFPQTVEINNTGSVDIYIKLLDTDDGSYGDDDYYGYVPAGVSKIYEIENQEYPFKRIGVKLASSGSVDVYVEASRYNPL